MNVRTLMRNLVLAISSELKVAYEAKVDFDQDFSSKYGVEKGVLSNKEEHEVFAPVTMWLEAVDLVLQRLQERGIEFSRVKGMSGAGMQHGSVYWSAEAESLLANLNKRQTLVEQLAPKAFSHPNSPNWQDASTQKECDEFDGFLGSPEELAQVTGSKAHHVSSHHTPVTRCVTPQYHPLRIRSATDYEFPALYWRSNLALSSTPSE